MGAMKGLYLEVFESSSLTALTVPHYHNATDTKKGLECNPVGSGA